MGAGLADVPTRCLKPVTGACLGADAALQMVAAVLGLDDASPVLVTACDADGHVGAACFTRGLDGPG